MEVQVIKKILDVNHTMAEKNRLMFTQKNVFVLNVMSSPGSGKTTALVRTISEISPKIRCAVIVGDICTSNDANRLAKTGVTAVQVNTDEFGGDCHLAAHVIEKASSAIDLNSIDLLIIENIGNLVCPAEFDIGEDARIVVISVTEGEDKPLKYPLMFRECDAALYNKTDLLPHLEYNMADALNNILTIHPKMPIFEVSAKTGEGFEAWIDWLNGKISNKLNNDS